MRISDLREGDVVYCDNCDNAWLWRDDQKHQVCRCATRHWKVIANVPKKDIPAAGEEGR